MSPLHRHQHRAAPFTADADALDEAQDDEKERAPDADRLVSRDEADEERGDAHQQQRGDQRRLAADAVAVMAEDRCSDWPGDEPNRVDQKDIESRHGGIGLGEEQIRKNETGSGGIEKEVIPLDRRSDRARDNGSPELLPFVSGSRCHCHAQSPLEMGWSQRTLLRGGEQVTSKRAAASPRWAPHHLPSRLSLHKDAQAERLGQLLPLQAPSPACGGGPGWGSKPPKPPRPVPRPGWAACPIRWKPP